MSAFRSPCATSSRTSSSRAVRLAGFCCVPGRGPRGSPWAPRSRRRRATIAAAGRSAQSLQLLEGTAKGLVVVGVRERERGLVGTPELAPEVRRASPLAGDLERVGLGRSQAGSPPRRRRASASRRALRSASRLPRSLGELERGLGRLGHALRGAPRARQPRLSPPRPAPSRSELSRSLRQRERLVERRPLPRVSAPRPQAPERHERAALAELEAAVGENQGRTRRPRPSAPDRAPRRARRDQKRSPATPGRARCSTRSPRRRRTRRGRAHEHASRRRAR